jgi:hypothetical protein
MRGPSGLGGVFFDSCLRPLSRIKGASASAGATLRRIELPSQGSAFPPEAGAGVLLLSGTHGAGRRLQASTSTLIFGDRHCFAYPFR